MEQISTRQEYSKSILLFDGVAVVEGTATWCSQCKAIAPFVEKVGARNEDEVSTDGYSWSKNIRMPSSIRTYISEATQQIRAEMATRQSRYDTDTAPDIAQELGVNQMPTFHIFKDGDVMVSVSHRTLF